MNRITEMKVIMMLVNNIEADVKVKCVEEGMTQVQLGEKIGSSPQYVNRIIRKNNNLLNKTFVTMMEALGYDVQLTYVKRKGDGTHG